MKRISLTGGACLAIALAAGGALAGEVEPNLQTVIDETPANEIISALVYLNDQLDTKLIDEFFGWNQAQRAKDMQMHYAGRRERSLRARVTMMI